MGGKVTRLFGFAPAVALLVLAANSMSTAAVPDVPKAPLSTVAFHAPDRGDEKSSPPGCVQIVGKPAPSTCLPCPPLWLGGPTVRCVAPVTGTAEFQFPVARSAVIANLPPCPGLPPGLGRTLDSLVLERMCAYSAGE